MEKKYIIGFLALLAVGFLLMLVAKPAATIENNNYENVMNNKTVVFETSKGNIEIEVYLEQMPITAGNFLDLVQQGFYDGVKFHRVLDGFVIQGGDPNTKTDDVATYGQGGPGYTIEDEFVEGLSNLRGTLSMANRGPNTGGSQFFINLADNTYLDWDKEPRTSAHPVFGKVVSGMEVVDNIAKIPVSEGGLPLEAIVINRATIK